MATMSHYTQYHSQYLAHRITLNGVKDDGMVKSLSTACVDMNPHQVDAALFALASPFSRGVILADEVGLGKTIEAGLVIAQRWAERRRRILLIVPASLRKQWTQELQDKFSLPAQILEATTYRDLVKAGNKRPFDVDGKVVVTSYEFAARKADDIAKISWDLVIFDEAHRLRNVYRKGTAVRAKALRDAVRERFKILLTATPMQNSLMELFGLTSMIDDKVFGDEGSFRQVYGGTHPTAESLMVLRQRLKPFCRRTLRKDVQEAGHINYTKRTASTFKFEPGQDELELYAKLSAYLQRRDTIAFGSKPNQLVTLVVRKILGSSTFAVTITLNAIIERLKKLELPQLDDIADDETAAEDAEEWDDGDDDASGEPEIVRALLACTGPAITLAHDPYWRTLWEQRFDDPLSDAETFRTDPEGWLQDIGRTPSGYGDIAGQYMGLFRMTPEGWAAIEALRALLPPEQRDRMHMTGTLSALLEQGAKIATLPLSGPGLWGEVDNAHDRDAYERMIAAGTLHLPPV